MESKVVILLEIGHAACIMLYHIRFEDNFEDVLGKAAAGLGIGNLDLSRRSGVESEQLRSLLNGQFEEKAARAASEVLGLHAGSVVELAEESWRPEPVEVDGLRGYNTPHPVPGYEEMTVNSYLAYDPDSREAVVFDSGAKADEMLADIGELGLEVRLVLLTHAHEDHIKDLAALVKGTGNPPVWVHSKESISAARTFEAGRSFEAGNLHITTRLTNGHSPGGVTYVIDGLQRPVAIVGDSLFACSMGGARGAYGLALENNRKHIFTLRDETVVCPGHGPMTSVGEEKAHNPFFPEFKHR